MVGRATRPDGHVVLVIQTAEFLLLPDIVQPVSYTHLRAHETVLDLVCRLLLEKKNRKRLLEERGVE